MDKILIIIDAQNDFIDGKLGNRSATRAVPKIMDKITNGYYNGIFITKDSHAVDPSVKTIECTRIPEHCLHDTYGGELNQGISEALNKCSCPIEIISKCTFMSTKLSKKIDDFVYDNDLNLRDTTIEICGFCTDICVISNALYLRSIYPYTKIVCDSEACAGSTPEMHYKALDVMRNNLIDVIY